VDEELRAELLARRDEDQRIRRKAAESAPGPHMPSPPLLTEWQRIDQANTRWLAELTDRMGWPGRTLVGKDGAHAAWLLAQHSDAEHQRRFLGLLRAVVAVGEASARDLAYLEDRVRVFSGQPQLYGTQFSYEQDGLKPHPVEDPEHLDQRRATVGLGPFAEYEAQMHRRH
jgi:hypothetical protein